MERRLDMKQLSSLFKKLNIKLKITIAFSFVSILSLIVIVSISYMRNAEIIKENIQEMAARDANILMMDIERYFGLDSESYISGISHSLIVDILSKDISSYNIYEKAKLVEQLNHYVAELESNRITRIRIYVEDNRLLFADERNFFPMSDVEKEPWYLALLESPNEIQWSTPYYPNYFITPQNVITAKYLLKHPQRLMEPICVMSVDFSEKGLRDILGSRLISGKHYVAVIDDNANIISSTKFNDDYTTGFLSELCRQPYGIWHIREHNYEKYMTLSLPIEKTPWRLLYIVNLNAALVPIARTRDFMILLSCVTIVLLIALSAVLSRGITKRIVNLRNAAIRIADGNLEDILPEKDDYSDEISDLLKSFRIMVGRLDALLNERFQMAINLKNAEIKALQAQINPHFLYNTLDIISWRAIRQDNYDIYNLIKNLAKYYKLSLNRGRDIVPLSDELDHIRYYVNIQNERVNNNILLTVDVKNSFLNLFLPKLTLQPIVENSILHGLMEKDPPGGNIRINAESTNDNGYAIHITDDGVGIAPGKLEEILSEQKDNEFRAGFGLNNIRYRLRLSVGGDLRIDSQPGKGTKVTIILPHGKNAGIVV